MVPRDRTGGLTVSIGLTWPVDALKSWPAARMGEALSQEFTPGGANTWHALYLYAERVFGSPVYAIEVATTKVPQNETSGTADPTDDDTVTNWTETGAASVWEAVADDDDTSYVANPTTGSNLDLLLRASSGPAVTSKRIAYIEVEIRARAVVAGARFRAALKLNDVNYYGSWNSAPLDDWETLTTRWSYNPQGPSQWPWGDALALISDSFAFGLGSEPGIEVARIRLRIGYADDNRLGTYATSWEPAEGWNRVVYDLVTTTDPHHLTITPVVVDPANYAVFPLIAPEELTEAVLAERSATGLVTSVEGAQGASMPFVAFHATGADGQPYRGGSIRAANDLGDSLVAGASAEYQIIEGDGNEVGGLAVMVAAPTGTPTADLEIELYDTVLATNVATASIAADSLTRSPTRLFAYLDSPVTLVASREYHVIFSALAASTEKPYRIVRLDGFDQGPVYETLAALPEATVSNNGWTLSSGTDPHLLVDDDIGEPDETATFLQSDGGGFGSVWFQAPPGAFDDAAGRTIDFVAVVARAGAGGAQGLHLGVYVDTWTDHDGPIEVSTAFDMYESSWSQNGFTTAAWTPADLTEFEDGGSSGFGVASPDAGMVVTQCYMLAGFSDGGDLTVPLGAVGYESTDPGSTDKDDSDLVVVLDARPPAPENLTATADHDSGSATLSWDTPGGLDTDAFESYEIYREIAGTLRSVAGGSIGSAPGFTDYTVPLNTVTDFVVRTKYDSGLESEDAEASTTVKARWCQLATNATPEDNIWFHANLPLNLERANNLEAFAPGGGGLYSALWGQEQIAEVGDVEIVLQRTIGGLDPDTEYEKLERMLIATEPPTLKVPGRLTFPVRLKGLKRAIEPITGALTVTGTLYRVGP